MSRRNPYPFPRNSPLIIFRGVSADICPASASDSISAAGEGTGGKGKRQNAPLISYQRWYTMNMNRLLAVAIGGMIGSALRYLISGTASKYFGSFPVGTLIVNIVGGLLIGFIMEASTSFWPISANMRIFLTTGVMGGLTTFSTFSYETISFLSEGEFLMGGLNAGLNLFLALFACWGGRTIAQII